MLVIITTCTDMAELHILALNNFSYLPLHSIHDPCWKCTGLMLIQNMYFVWEDQSKMAHCIDHTVLAV